MEYTIRRLLKTEEYLSFFRERRQHHQRIYPDLNQKNYQQLEVDGFDKHSIHFGIFETLTTTPVGFARLTAAPGELRSFQLLPTEIHQLC